MYTGAITAMITPFRDEQVDEKRLRKNIEFQIAEGIDGLVPCGTTGESPTLSHDEHDRVIEVVVDAVNGRVPVIAGTGSNSTLEALRLTKHAKAAGADACLQVNPYYNKPTQEGMYRHFTKIADEGGLPIVLYNIPGRTNVTLTPQTVARLAQHENIVAIKEATGSLDIASEISALCDITLLSGDDSLTLPLMSVGGKGVISVLANIIPKAIHDMVAAALASDFDVALKRHLDMFSLFKAVFIETNPIPVKAAMKMMKMDEGCVRLPLTEMEPANQEKLRSALSSKGLLD